MFRKNWKGVMLLAAGGMLVGAASPAIAGADDRDRRGEHNEGYRGEHRDHGVLYINGRAYRASGNGALHDEVFGAFRRAGYRGEYHDGRYRIHVGARRPAVSWRGGSAKVGFSHSGGYLFVDFGKDYHRPDRDDHHDRDRHDRDRHDRDRYDHDRHDRDRHDRDRYGSGHDGRSAGPKFSGSYSRSYGGSASVRIYTQPHTYYRGNSPYGYRSPGYRSSGYRSYGYPSSGYRSYGYRSYGYCR